MPRLFGFIFILTMAHPALAEEVPFAGDGWEITAEEHRFEEVKGEAALFLKNGSALVRDGVFRNGVIEFDILTAGERGFSGVYFRISEGNNAEHFYIRPHQSGQVDANQYTPVFNGVPGWQMYFGPRFSVPFDYKFGEWMHIKIVISGAKADIYIDSDQPLLHVTLKQPDRAGGVGISSNFGPVWFANFRYEEIENPEITGTAAGDDLVPGPGALLNWQVSSAISETVLDGAMTLPEEATGDLSWQNLEVEDNGYANLARVQGLAEGANTALAKINIRAGADTTRAIRFGYSDRVKVFLNGALIYSGDNTYRTRDYRYLGTIGLFDEVALALREGDNELIFAVSESFGGWAIMAAIEDREGLEITP